MAGTVRRQRGDRDFRDPPDYVHRVHPYVFLRVINIPWTSIADGDLMPGELVGNYSDDSLVWRKDDTNICRFASAATRTI
jgi:hypothetical protein